MTNSDRIRILSVDDHALLREGIAAIVNAQSDMVVVGTASNGKEAIEAFRTAETGCHPDGPSPAGPQWHRRYDGDPVGIPRCPHHYVDDV